VCVCIFALDIWNANRKKEPSFKEGFFISQSSICMLVVESAFCCLFSCSRFTVYVLICMLCLQIYLTYVQ